MLRLPSNIEHSGLSRFIFTLCVNLSFPIDKPVKSMVKAIMEKFYDLLHDKAIRKRLVAAGIKQSTITMWKQKRRFPLIENARRLSTILRLPMKQIPWTSLRWERNEP